MEVSGKKKLLTDWKLVVNLEKRVISYLRISKVESSNSRDWVLSHGTNKERVNILGKYGGKRTPHPMCCEMEEGYEHCTDLFFVLC